MKRKLIATLLTFSMVFSLAGCQGADGETQVAAGETSVTAETTETGEKNLYGYDSPVTIKVGLSKDESFEWLSGQTSENNDWMELYKSNNIIPEILYDVDGSQAGTKLSTAIMSGNYPDIIEASLSDYTGYVSSGAIADITDILEEYASDELKEYLQSDGGLALESVTVNGRLYGLPRMGNGYDTVPMMFVRQDWLDNLGMEMPSTMDELKEVAMAFTFNDPDQNGVDDTYGLAIDGVNVFGYSMGDMNGIFYAYGAFPGNDALAMIEGEDGKVTWGGTNTEGMKKGLEFLQDLYAQGVIARDFITMDSNSIFEEAGAGRCGIWFAPMWGGMTAAGNAVKSAPDAHITSAQIPDGLDQGGSRPFLRASMESVFCVSSQCQNPEVLIKLMNLSVQKLCYPESEEEYYVYTGDGVKYSGWKTCLTPTLWPFKNYDNYLKESAALVSGDTEELNMEQLDNYNSMKTYLDAVENGTFDPEDPIMSTGIQLYTVFGDPQGSYAALDQMIQKDSFTTSMYDAAPTETMADVSATLNRLTIETIVKIITGDPVDNYDDFLKKWYAMGGQSVIDEAQAWVDSNN